MSNGVSYSMRKSLQGKLGISERELGSLIPHLSLNGLDSDKANPKAVACVLCGLPLGNVVFRRESDGLYPTLIGCGKVWALILFLAGNLEVSVSGIMVKFSDLSASERKRFREYSLKYLVIDAESGDVEHLLGYLLT